MSTNEAVVIEEKEASDSTQQKNNKPKRKRITRDEQIKRQANPKSRLVGQQKTMRLKLTYQSDILHEYLLLNQSTMLAAYERLAALLRMCSGSREHVTHITDWINKNVKISQSQIEELVAQREVLLKDADDYDLSVDLIIPDTYHTEFVASHPVATKMVAVARMVDQELNQTELLFFSGIINDTEYASLRQQATSIIRSNVDRIYKATNPGVRNGGRYTPQELMNWLNKGNKLVFSDLPQKYQEQLPDAQDA